MAHEANECALAILGLVHDVGKIGDFAQPLKKDCTDLARRIALLSHLLQEIRDFKPSSSPSPSPSSSSSAPSSSSLPCPSSSSSSSSSLCLNELRMAILAGKRLLLIGHSMGTVIHDSAKKKITLQFQFVTWQLERVLGSLPFDYFDVSDEVREQVQLVRSQLKRAAERNGPPNSKDFAVMSSVLSLTFTNGADERILGKTIAGLQIENRETTDPDLQVMVDMVSEIYGRSRHELETVKPTSENPDTIAEKNIEEIKKPDALPIPIPDDFRCPISLELMRDPVIVATGQTYERSFIQRWIDCGNRTCPKTQQKLPNLTLTPNYVLRSVISQWCEANNIQPPEGSANSRLRNNRSCQQVSGDRAAIESLVRKLSSQSYEERRSAAAEIRSLAKRNAENRIMIAQAGAIPILVNLLQTDDLRMQENAVTALLNLSIYDSNKAAIMLAGAVPPIVEILRRGSMEARENAAATLFSLSLVDENKITIGASGAIKALVELLRNGSARGKKDAATALFNLSIYQGNKVRAVRAGILVPLMKMLTDTTSECMVDEALTILSVLASNQDCKEAIAKANAIPLLIDLLRTGQPRNKENAAAILLCLCKKDRENLACIGRLGAVIPLTELTRSGTDRAKRKATSLLDHLNRVQQHNSRV